MSEPVSCTAQAADDRATSDGKARVTFRLQLMVVNDSGYEQVHEVARIERDEVAIETLGLTLAEGKRILKNIQEGYGPGADPGYSASAAELPGMRPSTPPQGASRHHDSHAVWEHRVEEPAAGTLPVPTARGKDLQPRSRPSFPSTPVRKCCTWK